MNVCCGSGDRSKRAEKGEKKEASLPGVAVSTGVDIERGQVEHAAVGAGPAGSAGASAVGLALSIEAAIVRT